MTKLQRSVLLFSAAISSLFMVSCDQPSDTGAVQSCDVLTVKSQKSYATYQVGNSITVEWCYPPNWPYSQTVVSLSSTNSGSVPNYKEFSPPRTSTETSLSFTATAAQVGDSCRIKITDYGKNVYAYSNYFKIKN